MTIFTTFDLMFSNKVDSFSHFFARCSLADSSFILIIFFDDAKGGGVKTTQCKTCGIMEKIFV